MLAIKLKMIGRKNQRAFRVIVQEGRTKLRGKNVEDIGWYDPHANRINIDTARADYWINHGAKPTATVARLLKRIKGESGVKEYTADTRKRKRKEKAAAAAAAANAATEPQAAAVDGETGVPSESGAESDSSANTADETQAQDESASDAPAEKAEETAQEPQDESSVEVDGGAENNGDSVE